ncbi:MAG TPA: hypothetical protein DEH22_14875 [Chloroflexi bacterium]|nr:hypothetical protein [Chloroflexota bacterium]
MCDTIARYSNYIEVYIVETIELSVFDHGAQHTEILRALLDVFEARQHIKVHLDVIPWLGSWSRMVQVALYKDGPDVSEIGSTWIGDFSNMNAVRAFTAEEIHQMGGASAFLKPSWQGAGTQSGLHSSDFTLWGMPWLADVRVIVYRRDIYEQAGIDLNTAFKNQETLEHTFAQLQSAGVEVPLVLPTLRSRIDLHILASWIWAEGGKFFDPLQERILFDQPEVLRGLARYFGLGRFLAPAARGLDDLTANDSFFNGHAATVIGGHWLLLDERIRKNFADKIGVIGVPPSSFVGGSHFVIWQHSRRASAAFKLIEFLAGSDTPLDLYPGFGFPTRLDAIARADFVKDPNWNAMIQAAAHGRTIPVGRLWGMIEKRLVDLIPVVWHEIFATENPEVEAIVSRRFTAVAERLRLTLHA